MTLAALGKSEEEEEGQRAAGPQRQTHVAVSYEGTAPPARPAVRIEVFRVLVLEEKVDRWEIDNCATVTQPFALLLVHQQA
ncbi:hypothetical protein NDU88_002788 [Pleurodeles waltl]|uniref:Uncharacterized protein n=1 Tax=Pleurodeles waltl TaxID=8319 RepID=A0AAV7T2Z1_PLEWA|nr:hypothetical protein NDU88_002788 [Pleurodeles waltl]